MKLADLLRGNDRAAITLRLVVTSALTAASAGAGLMASGAAHAAKPGSIRICHATSATANPYVVQHPDASGDVSGHAGHTGPVYAAGMTSGWGDIIPSFTAADGTPFAGLNWGADGQAIYNNNCNLPGVVDQLPTAVDDAYDATEGDAAAVLPVLANDTPGDTPTKVVSVTAATAGTAAVTAGGGSVTFTAPAVGTGAATATFDYVIQDNDGDQSAGNVTVILGRKPLAAADAYPLTKGALATTLGVRSNDALGDAPTTIVAKTDPTLGSVSIAADGLTVSYTPPASGVAGTADTFTYTIRDADGDQSTATVTISLGPADLEPVAADDTYDVVAGDAQLTMSVLTNDTAGDGASTITSHTAPAGVAQVGSSFTYTPPAAGAPASTLTFTYTVADADGDSSTATVTIHLAAADLQPVAADDTYNVTAGGGQLTMPVLANDTAGNGASTITSHTAPAGVAVSGGSFTYTPPAAGAPASTFTFTYTVSDADGDSSTATVSVKVAAAPVLPLPPAAPVPDLAVKVTGPASVDAGSPITWTLTVTNKAVTGQSGFTVTDAVSEGVSVSGLSGAGFDCTLATLVCVHAAVLAPGGTASITVSGTVDEGSGDDLSALGRLAQAAVPATVTNTATVTPTDMTPLDNTDSLVTAVTTAAGPADLVLAKTAPANPVRPRHAVTWTITVTNVGGTPVGGFTVTDPLANGLSFVSAAGEGFSCQGGTSVVCAHAGPLAPGATVALLLMTVLEAGYTAASVSNTATAALTDDPTPANNTDEAAVGVIVPIDGGTEQPGTGPETGGPAPAPAPHASASPLPSAVPFVDEQDEEAGEEQPRALPFTGGSTDLLLGLGAGLSVIGLLLALTGRRRRLVE